jgi:ATP-dependent DNA helicase RecG
MHGKDLRNFFLKTTKWDALTDDYSLDEIDEKTVKRFIQLALRSGRLKSADIDDDLEVTLERLNLINKGKLTNASIILFGINPQKHFINAIVRVGKFKDDITIIGDRLVDGNLFQQVNEAEEAIKNLIAVKYEINGDSFIRKNIWDYPLEAIREALLNSIIHRDYHRHDVQTQIKIYNDHISFFNVGGLPEGMTVKKLITEHSSVARNPLIARVFYLSGLIEEYGSGIQRMMRSLNDAGLGEVRFQDETISFKLYFFRQLTHEKLRELGLNERQIVAMDYLKIHGSISTSEYSKIISSVAKMTLRRDMVDLIDKKLIKAVGDKKGRYYELL